MINVLFVCLGNICRSPLAEAIFDHKVKERSLEKRILSDSCGTSDYHIGKAPDQRSIVCAQNKGIAMNHLGRQIGQQDLKDFDYLMVMDESNLSNVRKLMDEAGVSHEHLYLMREFQSNAPDINVPDPYWGEAEDFDKVFDILDESLESFLLKIINEHQLHAEQ